MTERAEHTVGPWTPNLNTMFIRTSEGKAVASIYGDDPDCFSDECGMARTRLIAAAPDLLAALCALVEVNENHNDSIARIIGKPLNWKDDYLDAARAAISAATGANHDS